MQIELSHQEMFDLALEGVIGQGRFSTTSGAASDCRYRLDESAECPIRCGIGHIIPDEMYTPAMEGSCVISLNADWQLFKDSDKIFLDAVQSAHDMASDADMFQFKTRMQDVARQYNLLYPTKHVPK